MESECEINGIVHALMSNRWVWRKFIHNFVIILLPFVPARHKSISCRWEVIFLRNTVTLFLQIASQYVSYSAPSRSREKQNERTQLILDVLIKQSVVEKQKSRLKHLHIHLAPVAWLIWRFLLCVFMKNLYFYCFHLVNGRMWMEEWKARRRML